MTPNLETRVSGSNANPALVLMDTVVVAFLGGDLPVCYHAVPPSTRNLQVLLD